MPAPAPLHCPVCAGLVWDNPAHIDQHAGWHLRFGTAREGETLESLRLRFREVRALLDLASDDTPTTRLPPIGQTTRRRPPVPPPPAQLVGAELLHALGRILEDDPDVDPDEARALLEETVIRRGAYGRPIPPGECGADVPDGGGGAVSCCRLPLGHTGRHSFGDDE